MRFVKSQGARLHFVVTPRERELIAHVLGRYPVLDADYHRVTRKPDVRGMEEAQALLIEAMAEQQRENRRLVEAFLKERLAGGKSDASAPGEIRLALSRAQVDWLLEILNDVRVGCWVRLGRPDGDAARTLKLTPQSVADFGAMEFAGYLQQRILEALEAL